MGRLVSMTVAQSWYRTVECVLACGNWTDTEFMVREQLIVPEDPTGSKKRCVASTKDTVLVIDR